jgi:hypothetical protein
MSDGQNLAARAAFDARIVAIVRAIGDRALDDDLAAFLNTSLPADGAEFADLAALIARGAEEGWLCAREAGGVRFGRAIKPGEVAGRFSVDVVLMPELRGPHHVHGQGEIGFVLPLHDTAKFDGMGRGWYVYPPGSSHHPTVQGGSAYVLYLLPEGAIEFTGR